MNYFSHNPLYRFSELRPDAAHINSLWQRDSKQVLLISDLNCSFRKEGEIWQMAVLEHEEIAQLEASVQVKAYLGSNADVPYFVIGVEGKSEEIAKVLLDKYEFHDLKSIAVQLPQEQSALLAYARGLVHWNLRHKHCPDCGHMTQSVDAGHVRQCSNDDCAKLHFPRTDTAVITLISEGDACLLGRQAVWAPGQYATIAGFLEPGETLEQAVAREAMEETGVQLQSIKYHSSQPWPFPSSIMVGFMATAVNRNIMVNYDEMDDARWFTRQEIVDGLAKGTFRLPSKVSISYRLIQEWFNADPNYKLED